MKPVGLTGQTQKRPFAVALAGDEGMTLPEVLVAIFIFGILASLLFTTVISAAGNVKTVRQNSDLTEESRLVLNRISRELRQASKIVSVTNPDFTNPDGSSRTCGSSSPPCFNSGADTSVTFQVDFNGDGFINTDPAVGDVEQLTYHYDQANGRLLLETPGGAPAIPILSANVSAFKVSYRSSNYSCDVNSDGQVTWQEIELATSPPCPTGAGTNNTTLDTELTQVDQLIIDLTVLSPPRQQQYRTKVDLRNRN